MAQNPTAIQAYRTQRDLLQQALQEEREVHAAIVRAAEGGARDTAELKAEQNRLMRLAGMLQHEIDLLAEKHWG